MKFSIRDLLLVTVIVALAVGWGLDHWRQRQRMQNVGGYLTHFARAYGRDIEVDESGQITETTVSVTAVPNSSAPAPNQPKD